MALRKATATITDETNLVSQDITDIKTALSIDTIEAEQIVQDAAIALNTAKRTYPLVDEQKLATIASGAEVNVNADWNAVSGDAQIMNKPTIPTVAGSNTQIQFNNANAFGASANLTWDGSKFLVTGFVSAQGATATATSADTIANDTNGFVLTARSGQTDKLYGQRIKGTLTFNTLNQVGYGLLIDLSTNATASQLFYPLVVQTSVAAVAGSEIANTSMSAGNGSELSIRRGVSAGQILTLTANSGASDRSHGIFYQDFENTNMWSIGWANSDYLRFAHRSDGASVGAVDPTMYIQDNRVAIGRYAAAAIGATLDVRGEGTTTALSFRIRNASNVETFSVLDNGTATFRNLVEFRQGSNYINFYDVNNNNYIQISKQINGLTLTTLGTPNNYLLNFMQITLGIGTASPNASALVDITSTTRGFLPPRMTTAQKTAIATPATGLVVYDTTLNKLCLYAGTGWETITSA